MTDKTLKSKSIDIKGKKYVQVKDRVTYFNDTYPNGSIVTKILSDGDKTVMMARVTPDVANPNRVFTGISASNPDKQIEKMSPYEVAETSAVGRALALMGIGVIDSIASADEMHKVGYSSTPKTSSDVSMDVRHCDIHNVDVEVRLSKSTGKKYAMHMVGTTSCFVNSQEEIDGFRDKQADYAADNIF